MYSQLAGWFCQLPITGDRRYGDGSDVETESLAAVEVARSCPCHQDHREEIRSLEQIGQL